MFLHVLIFLYSKSISCARISGVVRQELDHDISFNKVVYIDNEDVDM